MEPKITEKAWDPKLEDEILKKWEDEKLYNFKLQDEILSKSTIKAVAVTTNAEIIKNRISQFYSVLKHRIYLISQQPSIGISKFNKINETLLEKFKNP